MTIQRSLTTSLEDLVGIEHVKLGFFQDLRQKIEELKKSNKQSEERRREIGAILDGITDLMMVLSEDMRILSVNHVFYETFPEVQEPEGEYCYRIFRNEDQPCPECPAFKSLSTEQVWRETAIFRICGRNRHFEMVASPLKNPEWPQHRVLIFKRDVTMEKEYQAKYYQAEKMATIGVLAAGVAHEVNNPLAAVAGFAQGIHRRLPVMEAHLPGEITEDLREYLDIILKECRRCQDIVQTLLRFSRPRAAVFAPTCLNQVVRDTLLLLQHLFKRREGLNIEISLAESLPLIQADAPQLKQVVLNLLTNALDAIEEAGTISIRTAAHDNEGVVLEVRDSGCGIPQEHLDKLFEPFFTTKPVGQGIGIGLATCYSIVEGHHGTIQVSSSPENGSTFVVILPADPNGLECEDGQS